MVLNTVPSIVLHPTTRPTGIVPTAAVLILRLLITATAATPRLTTTLHRRRTVIRRLITRALPRLTHLAALRVVATMGAVEEAEASTVAAGEAALTAVVAADLMVVTTNNS